METDKANVTNCERYRKVSFALFCNSSPSSPMSLTLFQKNKVCHLPKQNKTQQTKTAGGSGVGVGWGGKLAPKAFHRSLDSPLTPPEARGSGRSGGSRGPGSPGCPGMPSRPGGRRVPLAAERAGLVSAGREPCPLTSPDSRERAPLTLGPRGPVSPLGPLWGCRRGTKGTGLETTREESWGAVWLESTAKGQRITSTPVVSWSVVDSGGGVGRDRT